MFSFLKKTSVPEYPVKTADVLLDDITRHADLTRRLNSITSDIVDIKNKKDFVEHFKTYLGNPLSTSDFLDVVPTKQFKHKAYKYIFAHHQLAEFVDDYTQVITKLKDLKAKSMNFYGKEVLIFHDYDNEIGAVKMTLGKFWSIFPRIIDVLDAKLHHDLLVVSSNFSFGICVEIEGLNYSMSIWGFDTAQAMEKPMAKYIGDVTL